MQIKQQQLFDIPNYEGVYSITCNGEVYSWKSKIYLKPQKQNTGYLTVNLYHNKKMKVTSIHRIVAEVFCEKKEGKNIVNHKNLNKHDNNSANLEWVTHQENLQHACNNGIRNGEKNGNSKLNKNQIIEIRSKYKFRKYTYLQLSKEYGVIKNYIARIVNKEVWKHL